MKNLLLVAFYFLMVDGLALLAVAWAVVSLGRGEYFTAIVVSAIAFAFVSISAALAVIIVGRVNPRATFSNQGTTIRPDRKVDRLIQWGTVAAVVATATYAICAPQGKINIPLPYGNQRTFTIVAIGLAFTGIANLWTLFRRGGVSFLRLDPQRFELGQGVSSVHGEWNDVVGITDRRPGKSPPFRATLFIEFCDGRIGTQVVDSYTPGGETLRRLVRYYWVNPDRRDELVDGRALERLV